MKIIGFVYRDGQTEMVLKGDSCLLNGRKPFFLPEGTHEIGATECVILRVSRLGKGIAPKFAARYYDAVAPGVDFIAMDLLRKAQAAGKPWTQAIAFDYSLAIGEYEPTPTPSLKGREYLKEELVLSPEEAIAEAGKLMTIRQGDLVYIQLKRAPRLVHKEEIIRTEINGEEKLYCKIK
jgi:2-keto-4-pentenoate hydratase/2-oxohepta-3-ene-1,7-dioic acid hydratase in catechol pathway